VGTIKPPPTGNIQTMELTEEELEPIRGPKKKPPKPKRGTSAPTPAPAPTPKDDELGRRIEAARGGDATRRARLLVEQGVVLEVAGDERARALYDQAMQESREILAAVRGARRVANEPSDRLALLDRESKLIGDERTRADLAMERARLLSTIDPRDEAAIEESLRTVLRLVPDHAEALVAMYAHLVENDGEDLAAHHARLARAYSGDPVLAASHLVARGRVLEARGDDAAAEGAYSEALALRDDDPFVRAAYERVLDRRGNFARLRDLLEEDATRARDPVIRVQRAYDAARISAQRLGDESRAIPLLREAAAHAPSDPALDARVLELLVRLLESQGDLHGAATARAARILHEREPAVRAIEHVRLAADREALADTMGAIDALEIARGAGPLDAFALLTLDRLYATVGKDDARVNLWLDEAARAREPEQSAAAYVRAARIAEVALGRSEDAIQFLQTAWVSSPGDLDTLDTLTRLLLAPTTKRDDAGTRSTIDLLLQAADLEREPARKIAHLEKAAALLEDVDPERAATVHEQVLAIAPSRRLALLALERCLQRTGDHHRLATTIEREAEVTTDVDDAVTLRLRAVDVILDRVQDPERAIALARRVADAHPKHERALVALLRAQTAARRHEDSLETIRSLIALLESKDRRSEALPLWLTVAETCMRRLGRVDDAIAALRSALEIDPAHPAATHDLSRVLRASGRYAEAAETMLAWDPVGAAEIFEGRLNDDARAEEAYAAALEARPTDLAAFEGLVRVAERRKRWHVLERAYEARIAAGSGITRVPSLLSLAEVLVRAGRDSSQVALVAEAVLDIDRTYVHALRFADSAYRRGRDVESLIRTISRQADATGDRLARRGLLWELARLRDELGVYLLLHSLDASDPPALHGLLRAAARQSSGNEVALALGRMIELEEDAGARAALILRLALHLELEGPHRDLRRALALHRSALRHDPESPTAVAGVLRLAPTQNDAAAQLEGEVHAAKIALDPETRVRHLLVGAQLARAVPDSSGGGIAVASDLVAQALQADPDSVEAATAALQQLLATDVRRLVDLVEHAAQTAKRPDRIVALAREGASFAEGLSELPRAILLLEKARAVEPRNVGVLVELGDLERRQRAWAEAVRSYDAAIGASSASTPVELQLRAHVGLAELHGGPVPDPLREIVEMRAIVRLDPENVEWKRALARTLGSRGQALEADSILVELASLPRLSTTERVEVWNQLSDIRLASGDKSGADQALREALKLDPDPTHPAWSRLEAFHARHLGGEPTLAEALNDLIVDPKADPRWVLRLGILEMHLGRTKPGIMHLRMAVKMVPNETEAMLTLASGLLTVAEHDEALSIVRTLTDRDPTNASTLALEERARLGSGLRDEANVVVELRAYLGQTEDATRFRKRTPLPRPPLEGVLDDAAIAQWVLPEDAAGPAVEVLATIARSLTKVLPPTPLSSYGVGSRDRVTQKSGNPLRVTVDRAIAVLGTGPIDLFVSNAALTDVAIETFDPPAIIVPSSFESLSDLELGFAIDRAVARVALGAFLLDKVGHERAADLVTAAIAPFGAVSLSPDVEDLARRIAKAIPRDVKRKLESIASEVRSFDSMRFARALDRTAVRIAYLLTGDLSSSLDHVLRTSRGTITQAARPDTLPGDLVRFALGESAVGLRKRLGTIFT